MSRRDHEGNQPRHTRVEQSEKCVALQDRCGTKIGVITAFFACALWMCLGRSCTGLVLLRQEVRAIYKTRNQLTCIRHLTGGFRDTTKGYLVLWVNHAVCTWGTGGTGTDPR